MIDFLNSLDHSLTLAINSIGAGGGLDSIARFFSRVQVWFPMYLLIAGHMFYKLGWKRGLTALGALILCVVACDQGANLFKDHVFMRLRPCFDEAMMAAGLHVVDHYPGGYFYGFFSGHAANCFGFALLSRLIYTQDKSHKYHIYGALIFIWATLVSLSRIICGKHFLGDVFVGAIFGCLVAWVIYLGFKAIISRFSTQK